MTIAYVYKWTHTPTMMWYVGSRTAKNCHPNDGYICSSKYVKPLIEADKTLWKREIISTGSPEEMRLLEGVILYLTNAKNDKRSFNRNNITLVTTKTSSQGKIRMHNSEVNIFVKQSDVQIYLDAGWKFGFSKKVRDKMRMNHADMSGENNPMFGTSRLGLNLGRKHSEDTRAKLCKPKSSEHKKKLSKSKQGINNPMFGKTRTKVICSNCFKEVTDNTYARWHGINCKHHSNIEIKSDPMHLIKELKK
jgi:hypothetical protein